MAEVTKEDINQIHARIEGMGKDFYKAIEKAAEKSREADDRLRDEISKLVQAIAVMQQQNNDRERPCDDLVYLRKDMDKHIGEHKADSENWSDRAWDIARLAIAAGLGYLLSQNLPV